MTSFRLLNSSAAPSIFPCCSYPLTVCLLLLQSLFPPPERARGPHEGRIEANQQHVIWFSGLRGAVAFACAQVFPDANGHRELFLITTMSVVLFTVFTMCCGTVPVLKVICCRILELQRSISSLGLMAFLTFPVAAFSIFALFFSNALLTSAIVKSSALLC